MGSTATPPTRAASLHSIGRPVVALDLDGTVFDIDDGVDIHDSSFWDSPRLVSRHTWPNELAHRAWRLHSNNTHGADVVFVTGRTRRLQAVTLAQLAQVGFEAPLVEYRPAWMGLDSLAYAKADALVGACVYIGDLDSDREAAGLAEVPFIHVDDVPDAPLQLAPGVVI